MKRIFLACFIIVVLAVSVTGQNGYRKRFDTESIDSTTISIRLDDGTKTIFLVPNSMPIWVYSYRGGAIQDSIHIKPGVGYNLDVRARDSLRVERKGMTIVNWAKNTLYDDIFATYVKRFSKACPYAHGDTLDGVTMTYGTTSANGTVAHPGYCNNFQSLECVMESDRRTTRMIIKMWYNGHQIMQMVMPSGEVYQTTAYTFDSLWVGFVGPSPEFASYSVSWNHGAY